MLDEIYNRRLLGLAASVTHIGRLAAPQGTATVRSRLCGSTVTVDVVLDGEVVREFAQEVKACALGQASASLLAAHVVGASVAELEALLEGVRAMLKEDAPPPEGRWTGIDALTPVREVKARHASTLLPFEAVVQAAHMARARQIAAE